jgi:hypothetical protein
MDKQLEGPTLLAVFVMIAAAASTEDLSAIQGSLKPCR